MGTRSFPALFALTLLLAAPARADDAANAAEEAAATTEDVEDEAGIASRLLPALAAGGTSALVAIPASALGVAGGTAVCVYTLGFGGVVGLPFVLAPLACGLCGGAAGTLVGVFAAGDDVCQPFWVGAGAGIGLLSGGLGILAGAAALVAAWGAITQDVTTPGSAVGAVDEVALYGGLLAGGATAALLALGSVGVATLVALIPARPVPTGDTTVVEQRVRVVRSEVEGARGVIAY